MGESRHRGLGRLPPVWQESGPWGRSLGKENARPNGVASGRARDALTRFTESYSFSASSKMASISTGLWRDGEATPTADCEQPRNAFVAQIVKMQILDPEQLAGAGEFGRDRVRGVGEDLSSTLGHTVDDPNGLLG
ncbi:hypothetical protein M4578_19060 [Salipiger sp. P9]|uniref:hypothetical protein n=1 Tax=Salipiger pentaromativorans TaxID=2943193 RepID=UPI002157C314|nr:hypothetical protein [Salipiger pentaromativorans]MCR8549932.1 hypothetical protein [Salipiger pentaromativorans]